MMKRFPAGSTAIILFLLGLVAWMKGGAHWYDAVFGLPAVSSETDLKNLSDALGTDPVQRHLVSSRYSLSAGDVLVGLSLLFGFYWYWQRARRPMTTSPNPPGTKPNRRRDRRRRR